jgi:hypothetical protein
MSTVKQVRRISRPPRSDADCRARAMGLEWWRVLSGTVLRLKGCEAKNMSQTHEVRGRATSIRTDANGTHVRYHNTDVVTFNDEYVILRTGGWQTNTTRTRMNQASNQFRLGLQVFQKDFSWYVQIGESVTPFIGDEFKVSRESIRRAA